MKVQKSVYIILGIILIILIIIVFCVHIIYHSLALRYVRRLHYCKNNLNKQMKFFYSIFFFFIEELK